MNAMRSARGSFIQFNSDGSRSSGQYYLDKPGRMRFEYAAPHPHIIVADGTWVAVVDRNSNDTPAQYPVSQTPLNLILRDRVNLAGSGAIQRVVKSGSSTTLHAIDPSEPGSGRIELVFDENPLALREWTTVNPQGQRTQIRLTSMEQNVDLSRRLFSIQAARG